MATAKSNDLILQQNIYKMLETLLVRKLQEEHVTLKDMTS